MSVDRLSDMLSSLRNASLGGKSTVETFYSKENENVAKVLKDAGFLSEVKVFKPKGKSYKGLSLEIANDEDSLAITDIKRMSKPGRRYYATYSEIDKKRNLRGVIIVSTNRGVMNGKEATKRKLGGEILCRVY